MIPILKSDIISLIKNHRLIFFVLVISIACSFLIFSMMTGVINYRIEQFRNASSLHTFSIDFNDEVSIVEGEIVEKLINDVKLRTLFFVKISNDSPLIAGWYGRNDDRWFVLDEGSFFDENSSYDSLNVAVVSQKLYPGIAFEGGAHSVSVNGKDISIIGVGIIPAGSQLFIYTNSLYEKYYPSIEDKTWDDEHDHEDKDLHETMNEEQEHQANELKNETIIIPIDTFIKFGLKPQILRLEYNIANKNELDIIYKELTLIFPNTIIYKPILPEEFLADDMTKAITGASIIIIGAFVNIIALFIYWLIYQKRTHSIYLLCGARKITIVRLIFIEWGIIMLIGYAIYIIIQSVIAPAIDFLSIKLVVELWKHILLYIVLFIVSIMMMSLQIKKNTHINLEVI